jgi:hypothetical protein
MAHYLFLASHNGTPVGWLHHITDRIHLDSDLLHGLPDAEVNRELESLGRTDDLEPLRRDVDRTIGASRARSRWRAGRYAGITAVMVMAAVVSASIILLRGDSGALHELILAEPSAALEWATSSRGRDADSEEIALADAALLRGATLLTENDEIMYLVRAREHLSVAFSMYGGARTKDASSEAGSPKDPVLRAVAAVLLARTYLAEGNMDAADAWLRAASSERIDSPDLHTEIQRLRTGIDTANKN